MLPVITARTPHQFLTLYAPVTASSPATGEVKFLPYKYLSRPSSTKGVPREISLEPIKFMLGFYKTAGEKKEHGIELHKGFVVTVPALGLYQTDVQYAVKQCHLGKGTPLHLRTFALTYTYWDQVTRARKGGYKPSNQWMTVQQYADEHLGVDCNGFAGAYYQLCFPQTGLSPHSDLPESAVVKAGAGGTAVTSHPFADGGKLRTGIDQLRAGDALIYTHRHVSVLGDSECGDIYFVNDVKVQGKTVTHTTGRFSLYQARGDKANGVQRNIYDITHTGGQDFTIQPISPKPGPPEAIKAIVRPSGVPEW